MESEPHSASGSGAGDETLFYTDDAGTLVSDKRLVFGGTTYARSSIASVTLNQTRTNRGFSWVIGIGVALLFVGYGLNIPYLGPLCGLAGLVMVATGIILAITNGRRYELAIAGSFGRARVARSRTKAYCERILDAWVKSIGKQ